MTVELNNLNLRHMLLGTYPGYDLISSFEKRNLGQFIGGMGERWEWNRQFLKTLSDQELWDIYQEIDNNYRKIFKEETYNSL